MPDDASAVKKSFNDNIGFKTIKRGSRTTPLHSAVPPADVHTPVPVRNYFRGLGNNAASDKGDSTTTPLLSRVLDAIPPPDVDDATTKCIIDSLCYTARVTDDALQNVRPRRTLTDALAKLDEVENYVIKTTDQIVSSMAWLTSSNNVMSGRLDEQNLLSRQLASNIEEHTAHITNLMEFEKAWRQQMDDHWKRLEEIEQMV
jgi:hypothetical protein